jgi:hypothetical protein
MGLACDGFSHWLPGDQMISDQPDQNTREHQAGRKPKDLIGNDDRSKQA